MFMKSGVCAGPRLKVILSAADANNNLNRIESSEVIVKIIVRTTESQQVAGSQSKG